MNKVINRLFVGAGLTVGTALAASAADDYGTIVTAVSIGGVVTAIIGMGAVKILPNVARWATNKVANFF